jgi:FAD/FMN-containing dehydrogenase
MSSRLTRRDLIRVAAAGAAAAATAPWWSRARAARASATARGLRELAAAVRGPVVTRGDPDMTYAAQLWNSRFDWVVPDAVVYAVDERDVQAAVRWAARTGTRIAARAGGHSYAGYSTTTSGVVLDISNLSRMQVNARERRASIGAGAQLVGIYNALAKHDLTIPGGSCPTVGISGLTLGGGLGFSGRRWGTTSDNVIAMRIVTADGRIRTIDRSRDEDLFWACRGGGGGNFGVVTAFLFRTHPAASAVTFRLEWDWADMAAVVAAWQRWAPDATNDVFSLCSLETADSGTPRIIVSGQYFGSADAVPALVSPLTGAARTTSFAVDTKRYIEAVEYWAQCTRYTAEECRRARVNPDGKIKRPSFSAKSDYVRRDLPPVAIDMVRRWVEARQTQRDIGSGNVIFDAYGGAINEVSPTATAFAHRDMRYSIQYDAEWDTPAGQAPTLAWLRAVHGAMRPFVTGDAYVNYIDSELRGWQRAYYGQNLPRLRDVKGRYDPDRVFRFAQAIPG